MRSWFLSYHSPDEALAQRLKAAIERKDPKARVFFAPTGLRAGGFWSTQVAREIAEATAFILLVGERGLGDWQVLEYDEALDKRVKSPDFAVILVLLEGQSAPGLPFLRRLHWIITADPASERDIARLFDAASGTGTRPGELWRYTSPYRGLVSMKEEDSDYFFGRERETVEVLTTLAAVPDKLPILLGNSGVGKSSLAQAGVLAALMRQHWPETARDAGAWPASFHVSRRWCFLTLRPGTEPVRSLVEAFLETWQLDRTSTEWPERRAQWVDKLVDGTLTLSDLLDQTKRRYAELQVSEPAAFFCYIDQGEELYVRADARQSTRFSEILAVGIGDPRLWAMMSLRADFLGELQKDELLYGVHRLIHVPPLREVELRDVVSRPAALLAARFETDHLAADIARRAAEESTKDVGALPLLSYLLDDMWRRMVEQGDGTLRLPAQSIDLGRVLVDRANAFIASHPNSEEKLCRIFTFKLATVREDGEPTRRRAWRSEFSDDEWRLVSELADHPNRLLITATQEAGATPLGARSADTDAWAAAPEDETYTEVAHEAIFRRWDRLRGWIAAEREFLAWRSRLEAARRAWQAAPDRSKPGALLMGFALAQAQSWLARRPQDVPEADREFIVLSRKAARRRRLQVQALVGVPVLAVVAGLIGWINQAHLKELYYWHVVMRPAVLTIDRVHALRPRDEFKECKNGCPLMVVVPAGTFTMGASEEKGVSNERPQHQVTFGRPFAVGKYEVTFTEWDICVAAGACERLRDIWGRGDMPVINVSWDNSQQYVAWLRKTTGQDYRLLSEAEWEYAARAGSDKDYAWGDDVQPGGKAMANCETCGSKWDSKQTAPVGQFPSNSFGINDMQGNVWEWVEDVWHENYDGAPSDGGPWTKGGDPSRRVARGGGWQNDPRFLRSAARNWVTPVDRSPYLGLRVARGLAP